MLKQRTIFHRLLSAKVNKDLRFLIWINRFIIIKEDIKILNWTVKQLLGSPFQIKYTPLLKYRYCIP